MNHNELSDPDYCYWPPENNIQSDLRLTVEESELTVAPIFDVDYDPANNMEPVVEGSQRVLE